MKIAKLSVLGAVCAVAAIGQAALAQGVVWSNAVGSPGVGATGEVNALHVSDVSGTRRLYAVGGFATAGGVAHENIAAWDGGAWSGVGGAIGTGFGGDILTIDTIDLGSGPRLYVSGGFWFSSPAAPSLARLEGSEWMPLNGGAGSPNTWVGFIRRVESPGGPTIWASGGFTDYVAAWNGSSWSVPGGGLSSVIDDAVMFDDGTGEKLYISGSFPTAGPLQVRQFARWDGSAFSAAGGGINGVGYALAVWDDGRGPAIYIGGQFSAVGALQQQVQARSIARWNGQVWEPLGSGMNNTVQDLAVFDDGTGPKLYATGAFTMAGGQNAAKIARWDGHVWSAVGPGLVAPNGEGGRALQVFDADGDGPGPARLYVGGQFSMAGGQSVGSVAAIVPCAAEIDGDAQLGVPDVFAFLSLWFAGDARAEFDGVAGIGVPDIFAFLSAWFVGC